MGNIELEYSHTNYRGEPVYRIVYTVTGFVITPLATLEGIKEFRDKLTKAIEEKEHEKD